MNKKYKILHDKFVKLGNGVKVYRIQALCSFGNVKSGDIGGYIQHERNLSHEGQCWIYDDAIALNKAKVIENAKLKNSAMACGEATITCNAIVQDNAKARGAAIIRGHSKIIENAIIQGSALIQRKAIVGGCLHIGGDTVVSDEDTKKLNNPNLFTKILGLFNIAQ